MYKLLVSLFFIFCGITSLYAQKKYPQNYFLFPIKPGQINSLSGNMGEIRPNHFHAGLDIRTDHRVGLPVYASADGYISRVKVSTSGYGNVMYIKHPNGYITVYAHLLKFAPELADYVRLNQYTLETFDIELFPEKNDFPVKKGQVIAYSGNSGGSGGPHLHYEIRDSSETILNPLLFGFNEIKDNVPPYFSKLGVKALNIDSRVNNEFGRQLITPTKVGKDFVVSTPVEVHGQIGFEIEAFDLLNGASFKKGVNCVEVKVDGKEIYYHKLDNLGYGEIGHINVHKDYEAFRNNGLHLQRCYIADGNRLNFYRTNEKNGKLTIVDNKLHQVEITIWDVYRNSSTLEFKIQGKAPEDTLTMDRVAGPISIKHQLIDNTLKISVKNGSGSKAVIRIDTTNTLLPMSYAKANEVVYLWDIRKGLPKSFTVDEVTHPLDFKVTVLPGHKHNVIYNELTLEFNETSLFDTLFLELSKENNFFQVGKVSVPLQNPIEGTFKFSTLPANKEQIGVYMQLGRSLRYAGGEWQGQNIRFKSKTFGTFTLASDNIPPTVRLKSANKDQVKVTISDNLSGIASWRATINGQWLLMNYDHKLNLLWSDKLDERQPLKGTFEIVVKDNAGNEKVLNSVIN